VITCRNFDPEPADQGFSLWVLEESIDTNHLLVSMMEVRGARGRDHGDRPDCD
jgi:hypothetical protein